MNLDSFVLAAATADLADEARAREHADAVEFRMDLADEPLDALAAYDGELPIVATNRAAWEGGEAPDRGRLETLAEAAALPHVEAVDVELASMRRGDGEAVAERAREHDAAVIVSSHDFERTPAVADLRRTLRAATEYGDVGKLAVTAADPGDVLDLLSTTWEFRSRGRTVATMAMGEPGRPSRAIAPLYGSRIGYAPVDAAEATAPGQYDLATLRSLIDRLKPEV